MLQQQDEASDRQRRQVKRDEEEESELSADSDDGGIDVDELKIDDDYIDKIRLEDGKILLTTEFAEKEEIRFFGGKWDTRSRQW